VKPTPWLPPPPIGLAAKTASHQMKIQRPRAPPRSLSSVVKNVGRFAARRRIQRPSCPGAMGAKSMVSKDPACRPSTRGASLPAACLVARSESGSLGDEGPLDVAVIHPDRFGNNNRTRATWAGLIGQELLEQQQQRRSRSTRGMMIPNIDRLGRSFVRCRKGPWVCAAGNEGQAYGRATPGAMPVGRRVRTER